MLSVALLFSQNLQVHVHSMDHAPLSDHETLVSALEINHDHSAVKHLTNDSSHEDHHYGVIYEMSASPDSLVQQLLLDVSSVDLYVLLIILLMLRTPCCTRLEMFLRADKLFRRSFYLTPLLRAPPR